MAVWIKITTSAQIASLKEGGLIMNYPLEGIPDQKSEIYFPIQYPLQLAITCSIIQILPDQIQGGTTHTKLVLRQALPQGDLPVMQKTSQDLLSGFWWRQK